MVPLARSEIDGSAFKLLARCFVTDRYFVQNSGTNRIITV